MSGQNTSSAVMQQRREPSDSLDDFPTPPWATRALIEHVIWPQSGVFDPPAATMLLTTWEPACNRGHMVRPLKEYFASVHASDIHDYGWDFGGQHRICDFLFPESEPPHIKAGGIDWIITNPPFRLAQQFAERATRLQPRHGFALLVRTAFLEGVGRYAELFARNPPSFVAQFTERVVMVKGRLDGEGSTATAYCWLVWMMGEEPTRMLWIPPCRRRLERPGDYPKAEAA